MTLDQPLSWAVDHPWPAVITAGTFVLAVAVVCVIVVRRTSGAVLTAGIGALVCTVYTADTSWRFAEHRLDMADASERAVMFAAGEVALLACAGMARANKRATATHDTAGTPGVPGVLVWCITGIQVIPAYSESGLWGGTVRAAIGPVMGGLLWHLAMGLEIRVAKPEALSTGLPAQIGHELRERLLSYLGLATRNRTAEQISRDRATARVVRLASRSWLSPWGQARLAAAVARSGAATNGTQRHELLQQLAGRRSAGELRTVPVTSPWAPEPVPGPYPATPLGVTGAQLRAMDKVAAVRQVHAARPDRTPAETAAICTEYGVPVSETQVRIALRTGNPDPVPAAVPAVPERPQLAPVLEQTPADAPVPDAASASVPDTLGAEYMVGDLHLDLTTEPEVRREFACAVPAEYIRPARTRTEVHARVPDVPPTLEDTLAFTRRRADKERQAAPRPPRTRTSEQAVPGVPAVPVPESAPVPGSAGTDGTASTDDVLERARAVDAAHRRTHGRPASIRTLKTELRIGQPKAERIRAALDDERRRNRSEQEA